MPELVKGGQGRDGSSLVRDAFVILFSVLLGASIAAGGAILHFHTQQQPRVDVHNIPPAPPLVTVEAHIQSPPVTVKATLEQPERIIERVKVSPVTVKVPRGPAPRVTVNVPNAPKSSPDRYGEVLPRPKGE